MSYNPFQRQLFNYQLQLAALLGKSYNFNGWFMQKSFLEDYIKDAITSNLKLDGAT